MKTSIKIKFSLFLAALLLLTVLLLSLLILRGIRMNQKTQVESYLDGQAQTANIYFIQKLLTEESKVPQTFLLEKGLAFSDELELITGQILAIYDQKGSLVSEEAAPILSEKIKETLAFALEGRTAYLTEGESLYYLTPLRAGDDQVGVIQFHYSLKGQLDFYESISQLFLTVGATVFLLSFLLGYFYFGSFASGIIQLEKMVAGVREGNYDTQILMRRDEIGKLSEGIHDMSGKIRTTILGMEEEERKLSLAVDRLSKLDKQQKQFIGNVTHEFKTPLTSIKAYLDLLEMYPDDEKLLTTARESIGSETRRLYDMVETVLELSETETYDFENKNERLEVKAFILEVTGRLKGKMDKFGLKLETDLTEAYIQADQEYMMMILMNLLDNAIKYNRTRGSILVKNFLQEDQVIIDVKDTGIGIPEEQRERIFDPFFTVDRNRSKETGGVGLGLSLARRYAEIQGGSISLISTGNDGTTFRITLPAYGSMKTPAPLPSEPES